MSAWVLAGVILTGAWTQLDEIGWVGWFPLAVTLALDRFWPVSLTAVRSRRSLFETVPLIACALLCAAILAHVALTAREEFGFGGDEGYHLSATRAFALYYLRAGPLLAAVLIVFALARWKVRRYAASIAMASLLAASLALPASALFGRYPTAFYHLATPLNVIFEIAGSPYPFTANHIVNALSLPAWLFVLRPLIIGRWPDWRLLPVALLVYLQPQAIVYLGSALLEPWAFVFLLLALEALVALEPGERWIAVPLAATATFFKETAILLLPTVWLIGCVEWKGWRPSLRRGAIGAGMASVTPFLTYYAVRRGMQIDRTFELAAANDIWTRARVDEWLLNVRAQLGASGMFGLVLVIVAAARHWLWIATAALLALFFFGDAASIPYTGYGRFLAYSLLAVCGALFVVTYRWSARRPTLAAGSAIIAALQIVPFARTLALDLEPDYMRNSMEWNGALIRLPIRALAGRIPGLRGGDQVRRVRIVTFSTDPISLQVAYPDLTERLPLAGDQQTLATADCRCRDNAEAVIAGFEWPAHFGATAAARSIFDQVSSTCVRQIETTCVANLLEKHPSGAVVGALGVGPLVSIALAQHDQRAQR